jgi:hypothetical protein
MILDSRVLIVEKYFVCSPARSLPSVNEISSDKSLSIAAIKRKTDS